MTPDDGTGISFVATEGPPGLRVLDPVDNHQYRLDTSDPVTPTAAAADRFPYPVDAAAAVETGAITLSSQVPVYARDERGSLAASVEHLESATLDHGQYTLELLSTVKCYLLVESAVDIEADLTETRIEFAGRPTVVVGARSRRTRPATTVTTTTDPADLLATVSTFGAALGTTRPERSYPSLRGHPPAVELGDELDTSGLTPPATDLRLELPETTAAALAGAPLAYYLGAPVRPAAEPRLVTDGTAHSLAGDGGFERAVERTLRTVFFMDCLVRYDGAYGSGRRLAERERLADRLDVDLPALYDATHPERVRRYLTVPYETIEPHLPQWKVAATARPTAASVGMLPFLVDDLAIVRTRRATREPPSSTDAGSAQADAVDSFLSDESVPDGGTRRGDTPPQGPSPDALPARGGADVPDASEFVTPGPADALERVWVGDGVPFRASKALLTAYHNRLGRDPGDGEIDITVVCNEAAMDEETDVETVYRQRDRLPFDVSLHHDRSTDELAALLAADHDYFHYIGHAEPDGLVCEDGKLDCGSLATTGVETFFLNACRSYEQARALVEGGAVAGVGSHGTVTNAGAVDLGRTMARLLEHGFPFRSALDLARDHHPVGQRYVVVGDGSMSVMQANTGTALLCELERLGEDRFELTLNGFPTPTHGLGTEFMPFLDRVENTYSLSSGMIGSYEVSREELSRFFSYGVPPISFEGDLRWTDDPDFV